MDETRTAHGASDETNATRFSSWTKRLCGLSPLALSKMQENTVGCDCPSEVPHKFKDLKWWASAVAGKSRHSSHPTSDKTYEHFRECIGMDFLEFKVRRSYGLLCVLTRELLFVVNTISKIIVRWHVGTTCVHAVRSVARAASR